MSADVFLPADVTARLLALWSAAHRQPVGDFQRGYVAALQDAALSFGIAPRRVTPEQAQIEAERVSPSAKDQGWQLNAPGRHVLAKWLEWHAGTHADARTQGVTNRTVDAGKEGE